MKSRIQRIIRQIVRRLAVEIINRGETNTMLTAALHVERIRRAENISTLHEVEFRAFSQWGEDGIIQYLIKQIPIADRSFIEFGVDNYTESNTRFLLINDHWRGLVLDGTDYNISYIKQDEIYWRYDLTARCHFVSRDNINDILKDSGFLGDVGILSIDIDGNEYWIWDAINEVTPRIVICEYNSLFGNTHSVTVPYDKEFKRSEAHYSHLYFGASLAALCSLADSKGYDFVGSNSAGNDAFFVRRDIHHGLKTLSAADGYVQSNFRDSRDTSGKLSFLSRGDRLECIKDLPLLDVSNHSVIRVQDII